MSGRYPAASRCSTGDCSGATWPNPAVLENAGMQLHMRHREVVVRYGPPNFPPPGMAKRPTVWQDPAGKHTELPRHWMDSGAGFDGNVFWAR